MCCKIFLIVVSGPSSMSHTRVKHECDDDDGIELLLIVVVGCQEELPCHGRDHSFHSTACCRILLISERCE